SGLRARWAALSLPLAQGIPRSRPVRRAGTDRVRRVAGAGRRSGAWRPDARLLSGGRPPGAAVLDFPTRPLQRGQPSRLVYPRAVRMTGFAELVAATNYSFLRGASHPSD